MLTQITSQTRNDGDHSKQEHTDTVRVEKNDQRTTVYNTHYARKRCKEGDDSQRETQLR